MSAAQQSEEAGPSGPVASDDALVTSRITYWVQEFTPATPREAAECPHWAHDTFRFAHHLPDPDPVAELCFPCRKRLAFYADRYPVPGGVDWP